MRSKIDFTILQLKNKNVLLVMLKMYVYLTVMNCNKTKKYSLDYHVETFSDRIVNEIERSSMITCYYV